ncbi:MAG: ribosomal-processing cysteine protease Prp [Clostridia bacterium]|nr:ribosomal-processing cysteine protease Prp [Clostridia bacterium]
MICIEYRTGKEKLLLVSGHAHYAEPGKDIVCAGISALYCALRMTEGVEEALDAQARCLKPGKGAGEHTDAVFDAMARGMRDIARKYPGHAQYREALG